MSKVVNYHQLAGTFAFSGWGALKEEIDRFTPSLEVLEKTKKHIQEHGYDCPELAQHIEKIKEAQNKGQPKQKGRTPIGINETREYKVQNGQSGSWGRVPLPGLNPRESFYVKNLGNGKLIVSKSKNIEDEEA